MHILVNTSNPFYDLLSFVLKITTTVLTESKLTPLEMQIFLFPYMRSKFCFDQCISIGVSDVLSRQQIFRPKI